MRLVVGCASWDITRTTELTATTDRWLLSGCYPKASSQGQQERTLWESSRPGQSWPQSSITIFAVGFPLLVPRASIFFTRSDPSLTSPKTTCLPSSQLVTTVVMKNCEPFVFGPALAIDRRNGRSCLSWKFSSLNLLP